MQIKNAKWRHIAPLHKIRMLGGDFEAQHFKYFMHFSARRSTQVKVVESYIKSLGSLYIYKGQTSFPSLKRRCLKDTNTGTCALQYLSLEFIKSDYSQVQKGTQKPRKKRHFCRQTILCSSWKNPSVAVAEGGANVHFALLSLKF